MTRKILVEIDAQCIGQTETEIQKDAKEYIKDLLHFETYKIIKVLDK